LGGFFLFRAVSLSGQFFFAAGICARVKESGQQTGTAPAGDGGWKFLCVYGDFLI
jgi:hypothetical protein